MLTTTETLLKGLAAGNESRWARFCNPTSCSTACASLPFSAVVPPAKSGAYTTSSKTVITRGAELVFTDNDSYPDTLVRRQ